MVKEASCLKSVDPYDWSFRVKKKFDRIDDDRQEELNSKQYKIMGKDKAKSTRSRVKSRHLGRWGFKI